MAESYPNTAQKPLVVQEAPSGYEVILDAQDVRPGYKQTEVGVIPTDWSCVSLAQLASNAKNSIVGGPFGSDLVSSDYVSSGVPVIRGQNMGGSYISGDFVFVSIPKAKELQANTARAGDLVFTQRGTLGQVSIVPTEPFSEYVISQSQMKLTLNPKVADAQYVYQYFSSSDGQKKIIESAIQTGVPHTNLGILKAYRIRLPATFTEQHAIATALSDVDALLAKFDQLIAKKRDLKQAVMRQLLTGQTRLPGFCGAWEVRRLGDVADLLKGSGLSKNSVAVSGYRKCILYGELFTTYGQVIRDVVSRTDSQDGRLSVAGDVLVPGSTTTDGIDLATASALLEDGVALGGDINIIRCRDANKFDARFLANYLTHVKKREIAERAQGTTIVHLYGRDLSDLSLQCPDLAEQTAIATVLSDMDAELANLEARRDKTRALKQGMMQELLTGRIRLL